METETIGETTRLSLRSNFLWNMGGTAAYALAQWGMLVAMAKIGSPEMVGTFSLALAIAVPVTTLAALSLRSVQATDARGEYTFGTYYRLRCAGAAAAMLIIAACAYRYDAAVAMVIAIVGLAKGVESVSDIYFGLFQKEERLDLVARSMMMKGPLSLVVLCVALLWSKDLVLGTLALLGSWTAILVLYDARNGRRMIDRQVTPGQSGGIFRWDTEIRLFWLALPLGVVTALGTLQQSIPRYVIEGRMDMRSLGVFSAMIYLMNAGSMLVTALGQAAVPRLAIQYSAGDIGSFVRLLRRLLVFGIVLGLGGVVVAWAGGERLLSLLYTPEFGGHPGAFLILMIAGLVSNVFAFLGIALTAMRVFKTQAPVHMLIAGLNLVLCLLLVGPLGLDGAAYAVLGGLFAGTVAYSWIAVKHLYHPQRGG
jgi:O-antigen/teichoic acid export membrane protein